jgi:phthalate 4,5-dioxygenase oxygenase subunit
MGETMRRYWIPALLVREIGEPDGPPVRVRLLGEDLVAFRDSDGRIGLIDEYCPHRRASLWFGRNEECGLRCVYHGWKFAVDGSCVDQMNEPEENQFEHKVRVTAYPTCELGGLVWAYMGPAEKIPPLPNSPGRWRRRRTGTSARSFRSATGCKASKAVLTPRTPRSCTGC